MADLAGGVLRLVGLDVEGVTRRNWEKLARAGDRRALCLGEAQRRHVEEEKPALLQISSVAGTTLLVQLALFSRLPGSLKGFCGDGEIMKVYIHVYIIIL